MITRTRQLFIGAVAGLVLVGGLVSFSLWQFASLRNVLLYLNGRGYVVENTHVDVGIGSVGEKRKALVYIRNLSFHPVRLIGLKTTCKCLAAEPLPIVIDRREYRPFAFMIHMSSRGGHVKQMARLIFDDGGRMRETLVVITGKCVVREKRLLDRTPKGT